MSVHEAIVAGDVASLRRALAKRPDIEEGDSRGSTPLIAAILNSQAARQLVPWLIDAGADVNARAVPRGHRSPESVLSLAARHADLATVKALIQAGARAREVDAKGYSILINAAYRCPWELSDERIAVLRHLIESGAPLDCRTEYNETALSVALNRGSRSMLKLLLEAGADSSVLQWTPLHRAIALGTLDEVDAELNRGAELEAMDRWSMTPFLFSLAVNRKDVAERLLSRGANLFAEGRCGANGLAYAVRSDNAEMLLWLLSCGLNLNHADDFRHTPFQEAISYQAIECVRVMLQAGVDIHHRDDYGHTVMHDTDSPEIIKLLAAAGGNLSEVQSGARRRFLRLSDSDLEDEDVREMPFRVTKQDYEQYHSRRFGRRNPERMNNPFWEEMVRLRVNGYWASSKFEDRYVYGDPVWCCDRFGQSLTALPDGRYVEIAGEHEDYYDPDFCIYNDVIVHDGQGGMDIYGYPREVFPPTDFHTATLVGDSIYVIGNLGYVEDRRPGTTPVFKLSTKSWAMTPVQTFGENPGWIGRHCAKLISADEIEITGGRLDSASDEESEQAACYRLNVTTGVWRRVGAGPA